MGRSAPPMIEPSWSKGLASPKSITKPVFFEPVEKVIEVPTLTQKALLGLASGISGFALAELPPLRRISIAQIEVGEPQVLAAAQMLAGLDPEQTSFLTLLVVSRPTHEAGQHKKQSEHKTGSCEIAKRFHASPQGLRIVADDCCTRPVSLLGSTRATPTTRLVYQPCSSR